MSTTHKRSLLTPDSCRPPTVRVRVHPLTSTSHHTAAGTTLRPRPPTHLIRARGLQSSIFQLNLSRFGHCQTETTERIPQKVLTLSRKVDECKPLIRVHHLPNPSLSTSRLSGRRRRHPPSPSTPSGGRTGLLRPSAEALRSRAANGSRPVCHTSIGHVQWARTTVAGRRRRWWRCARTSTPSGSGADKVYLFITGGRGASSWRGVWAISIAKDKCSERGTHNKEAPGGFRTSTSGRTWNCTSYGCPVVGALASETHKHTEAPGFRPGPRAEGELLHIGLRVARGTACVLRLRGSYATTGTSGKP